MAFMTDRPLSAREFLDECLAFKKSHPVQSRFFSVFLEGELTPEQLRLWAKDMYHYIQPAIPALTAWLAHAPTVIERDTARLVASNLAGELGFLREAEEEHGGNAEAALAPFTRTREQQALVRRAFQWTVLAHQGMQAGFDAFLS